MEPMLKFKVWGECIETGTLEVEAESKEAAIQYVKDNLNALEVEVDWETTYAGGVVGAEEVG